jgi:hypothetical protein
MRVRANDSPKHYLISSSQIVILALLTGSLALHQNVHRTDLISKLILE